MPDEAALETLDLEQIEAKGCNFNCLAFSCMMASGKIEQSITVAS